MKHLISTVLMLWAKVLLSFVFLIGLTISFEATFAQEEAATQEAQEKQNAEIDPNGFSSIPEALSRLLNRQKENRRFEELRDLRISLLADIPRLRSELQQLNGDLESNRNEQIALESRLDRVRSGEETPEMLQLKNQQNTLRTTLETTKSEIQRATTRRDRALAAVKAAQDGVIATQAEITRIKGELEMLRTQFEEKNLETRRLMANANARVEEQSLVLRSAEAALGDFHQVLKLQEREPTADDTKRLEKLQDDVRLARASRDKIEIEEMASGDIVTARMEAEALERRISVHEADLERFYSQQRLGNTEVNAAKRDVNSEQDLLEEVTFALERANQEIVLLETRISEQTKRDAESPIGEVALEADLQDLIQSESEITGRLEEIAENLPKANAELAEVENEINTMLIPRSAENEFKRDISTSFTWLVGMVIVLFFLLALWDSNMREVVFSAEAGIQFVTLFSLVIAIILFGITGILEGKELSALLGGISGYILGRSSTPSAPKPPPATAVKPVTE